MLLRGVRRARKTLGWPPAASAPRTLGRAAVIVMAAVVASASAMGAATDSAAAEIREPPGRHDLLAMPPGAGGGAAAGIVNPAAWATSGGGELAFWWKDRSLRHDTLDNFGFAVGDGLGFTWEQRAFAGADGPRIVRDASVGWAFGDRRSHTGIAWRWSMGDREAAGHEPGVVLGSILRPNRSLALGSSTYLSAESGRREGVVDFGIRPGGSSRLTLFGEYGLREDQRPDDGFWSFGGQVRPIRGLHLGARLRASATGDDVVAVFHAGLTIGGLGLSALPARAEDGGRDASTFAVRAGVPHRGLPDLRRLVPAPEPRRWEPIDLEARRVSYRSARWFDEGRVSWIDLARRLDAVRRDPTVAGVIVNLAGVRLRPSLKWELRTGLARCREAGKRVVVYLDRAGMYDYWVASVADVVFLDPAGSILLPGVAIRRTYLAGTLEKAGIGFEELRYYHYKSANESFARRDMSNADREQNDRVVEVLYGIVRSGVEEGRGLEPGAFDAIVDDDPFVQPDRALDLGLVDRIGRWDDVRNWVRREAGGHVAARTRVDDGRYPDERWGRPPVIALVWANGLCAMDSGLRGRSTARAMRGLASRRDVAAVVLRADSPGGDPLPSDLVAAAAGEIRRRRKPVVVSQGDVAASGGYWIGTESDVVLTTPLTITGSIGVIGGWVWDDGLARRAGLTVDGVQRGAHADLVAGVRYPLVGLRLPDRGLTDEERGMARRNLGLMYESFVGKVAEGRRLEPARVRELAQGRVWMGEDAVARDLCDRTGTLLDAIAVARERAGIDPDEEVILEEIPRRRLFRVPSLLPSLPGLGVGIARLGRLGGIVGDGGRAGDGIGRMLPADPPFAAVDWEWDYVRALAECPGEPLAITPPGAFPAPWRESMGAEE